MPFYQRIISSIQNIGVRDSGFIDQTLSWDLFLKGKKKSFTPSTFSACMVKRFTFTNLGISLIQIALRNFFNFLVIFYKDLNLKKHTSRNNLEECRVLLNHFLSSIQEDQALHQCFLEVWMALHEKALFIWFLGEKEIVWLLRWSYWYLSQ